MKPIGIRCLALLFLGLGSCGGPPVPEPAGSALRIGVQNNPASGLLFLTQELGGFAEEGVRVDLLPFPSGKLAVEAMERGEVDLAACSDMAVAEAFPRHSELRVIAEICEITDGAWIVARRDRGVETPSDLREKTIGTQEGSAVHYFLHLFLQEQRIGPEECQVVFLPATELPAALAEGRIDAYSMRNPFAARSVAELGDRVVEFHDPVLYPQSFCLTATTGLLTERPDAVNAVLRALHRSETRCRTGVNCDHYERMAARFPSYVDGPDFERYRPRLRLDQALLPQWEAQVRVLDPEEAEGWNVLDWIDAGPLERVDPNRVTVFR